MYFKYISYLLLGEALRIMNDEPERFKRLETNSNLLHAGLKKACKDTNFDIQGIELSPLKHIIYTHDNKQLVEEKLNALVDEVYTFFLNFFCLF